MPRKIIIAIDGPAGSGKSSTAKALACRLKLPFIDTGAMYRAVTLKAMRENISFDDHQGLVRTAKHARIELKGHDPKKQKVFLDGKNVTAAIRTPDLTRNVFHIAQEPLIRRELVKKHQAMGNKGGAVMDGRDIGTVVFPRADFKFFFTASHEVRAKRRRAELLAVGKRLSLKEVLRDMLERDKTDYTRKEGPLMRAKDAIVIDTSSLTIEATVDKIATFVSSKPMKSKRLSRRQGG